MLERDELSAFEQLGSVLYEEGVGISNGLDWR